MKTIITFGKTRFNRLLLVSFIMLLFTNHVFAGTARNWKGGTSSDWNLAANWSPAGTPAAGDILSIGVVNFTNQPIISSTPTSPASITFGIKKAATLTVNSGFTLTVNGPINQSPSSAGFGTLTNTLAGAGAISCTSLSVGDNTTFLLTLGNNLITLVSTIASLHVTGNVSVNSTNNGILIIGTCYNNAKFSLQGGTTTIDGTIFTANTAGGILSFTTASPVFSVDIPTGSSLIPVLKLTNASAINTASVAGSIDFYNNTGGTGTDTVYYSGTNQTVYANTTTCLDNSPQTYQNLVFSGAGTKTVGTSTGSTLSVGSNFTNSATTTDLSAFNPTVSIANKWANAGTVTGGSGNITAANLQNTADTIYLATGATTIGASGIQLSGGGITCAGGTVTDNGTFQNSGGALTCGSGNVIFYGDYQNTAGTFVAGTGTVFFSGGTQSLYDNSTTGTKFRKVTFNGTGTATITAGNGNFSVAGLGILTMTSPAKLIAGSTAVGGPGYLTLLSNANSTATVAAISGSSTITGVVNVQRLISGGSSNFRGYRLLSSPVNVNNLTAITYPSSIGYMGLSYLNANASSNGILTAGPGGTANGFSVANTNPLIYLYDESMTTSNNSFVSGKNVGITAITGASGTPAYSVTTLSASTSTPGVTIPVGNSILLYYVGSVANSVITSSRVPDNATSTAVGYLNQGDIPVVFWKTSSTSIPYHSNGGNLPGLNQVGNPYASTISLDQLYTDNPTISPIFWELNDQTGGAYISYNASSGTTSNSRASKYIVSGQGFIMQATGTGKTITFKEDQKVAYPTGFTSSSSPGALLLSMPPIASLTDQGSRVYASIDTTVLQPAAPALAGMHLQLQLSTDSLTNNQTGIYFNNNWSDTYNPSEDAIDISPVTKVHLASLSCDGSQLEINELGDYTNGKRIKIYASAKTTGIYNLSLADITNIDTAANNIFLVDKKMNDSLDMVRYRSYAFNIITSDTATYGANRFVLAIERKPAPHDSLSISGSNKKMAATGNMVIYPNPSNSIINISIGTNTPANYTEDIYDTSGKLVKHASEASNTFTEDISNYKLGVYIIELKDTSGNLLGKSKFVKIN